jgi:hypothetical protein
MDEEILVGIRISDNFHKYLTAIDMYKNIKASVNDRENICAAQQATLPSAFADRRQSTAIQLQQQQLMSASTTTTPLKMVRQNINTLPIVQCAKLGTGGRMSARELVKWYYSGGRGERSKGNALRELYIQIGVDMERPALRRTQATLKNDEVIDDDDINDLDRCVTAILQGGKEALPPERKIIPADTWRHIWRGDFNGSKKKVTGYHWKGRGDAAWHEGFGAQANTTNNFYEQTVRVRAGKAAEIAQESGATVGSVNNKVKDDASTFFPDAWNETRVKDAIELRDSQGKITTEDADGITLVKSGVTIYPTIG